VPGAGGAEALTRRAAVAAGARDGHSP